MTQDPNNDTLYTLLVLITVFLAFAVHVKTLDEGIRNTEYPINSMQP